MTLSLTLVYVIDDDISIRKAIGRLLESEDYPVEMFTGTSEFLARAPHIGLRTRNGNLSTVRSALLVDWSANALRRNAQPPSQSSWSSYPFCRKTSCNRVLERFL
jgi:CheY-like chemotaxis protein